MLLPGPDIPTIRRLRQRTTSVPAVVDEGQAIQGSSRIIDYIDERYLEPQHRLTPAEPELQAKALELEGWLDAEIGETVRCFFYQHALPHRELVGELFTQRGPWWAKMFYGLAYPKIARAIRGMYDINETTAAADAERLRVAFGRLDEILARGPYLLGDRFTRADLTLAALTAPILATVGTSDTLAGQGALPSHHPRSRPVSYGRGTVWTTMGSVPVASVTTNTW